MDTHPKIKVGAAIGGGAAFLFGTGNFLGSIANEVIPNVFKSNIEVTPICSTQEKWNNLRKDSQTKFDDFQKLRAEPTEPVDPNTFVKVPKSPDSNTKNELVEPKILGNITSEEMQSIFKNGLGVDIEKENNIREFTTQFQQLLIKVDPEQILGNVEQQELYSWFLRARVDSLVDMTPKRPSDGSIQDKATLKQNQIEYNKSRNEAIVRERQNKIAISKGKSEPYPLNKIPEKFNPKSDSKAFDEIWYNDHKNIVTKYITPENKVKYDGLVAGLNDIIEKQRQARFETVKIPLN